MRAYSLDIGQDEDLSEVMVAGNELAKATVEEPPKTQSMQGQVVALSLPTPQVSSARQSAFGEEAVAEDDLLPAPGASPARDLVGFWNEVQTAGKSVV